jgi:hypothetical protein
LVCSSHGGKNPVVQKNARERLLMLVEPALEVLFRATRQAPPCEHCGRSDADRDPTAVRAAGMILDRTGFGPSMTLQHQAPATPAHFAWVRPEQTEQMMAWLESARQAMERGEPRPGTMLRLPEATDAQLVEDDDTDHPDAAGANRVGD